MRTHPVPYRFVESGDEDLDRYLNLITSEHNQMPRFMDTVALSVQPSCDALKVAQLLYLLFDIDTAVGQQLDFTGQWIGIARRITVQDLIHYFSLDIPGLGLDEARWYGSDAERGRIVVLDDEEYRLVLKTRILANMWDGTRDHAYEILNHYFAAKGYEVMINDNYARGQGWFAFDDTNPGLGWDQGYWDQTDLADIHRCTGNMWMDVLLYGGDFPALILALLTGAYFDIRPAGVGIGFYRNDPDFAPRWDNFDWDIVSPGLEDRGLAIWDISPIFGWDEGPTKEELDSLQTLTFGHPPFAGWDVAPWALRIEPVHHQLSPPR